ncbi:MAG: choice-of-anchor tandem repeat NxxGxxAF-containing protein [Bacillota bacterium]
MRRGTKALAAAVMGALWTLPAWGEGEIAYKTIALTGQQAAGMGEGVTYGSFTYAEVGASGHVAYCGGAKGLDGNETTVLWAGMPNSPQVVLQSGALAEWGDGVKLWGPDSYALLNAQGEVAVTGIVTGAVPSGQSGYNYGIWAGKPGAAQMIVHENMPVPGAQLTFTDARGLSAIRDSGAVGFGATLSDGSSGAWVAAGGSLQPLLRSGDVAPGFDASVSVASAGGPAAVAGERWVISGTIKGPGITQENDRVLWRGTAGSLQPILREGDVAPGTNARFHNGGLTHVSAKGHVLAGYELSGGDTTSQNNWGMWLVSDSGTRLVVRRGDPALGMPAGVRMDDFDGGLSSDAGGVDHLILMGNVAGTGITEDNKMAVWAGEAGALRLVARAGDHAPGTPEGIVFGRHQWSSTSQYMPAFEVSGHVNALGQVAFMGHLSGLGIDNTNYEGIWATMPDGTLELVARQGELFDVGGGDLREILSLGEFVKSGGLSFNDRGELAFVAGFADGTSGVVVAYVPEPGVMGMMGVGAVGVLGMRRRR